MGSITIYTRNILEDGTVTVTGDPDTGYPEARLWDRSINFYWKDTATGAYTFHVDYGSATSCDALFIPRHNFNGEDMTFEHSENNADWTPAVTGWTQSGNAQIAKVMAASASKRYWRVTVTSMTDPMATEVFISLGYEFSVLAPSPPINTDADNVQWDRTIGGQERSTMFGDARKQRDYTLVMDTTGRANFRTAMAYLDGYSKPFFLKDHEGSYWSCRLLNIPEEHPDPSDTLIKIPFKVIEMI